MGNDDADASVPPRARAFVRARASLPLAADDDAAAAAAAAAPPRLARQQGGRIRMKLSMAFKLCVEREVESGEDTYKAVKDKCSATTTFEKEYITQRMKRPERGVDTPGTIICGGRSSASFKFYAPGNALHNKASMGVHTYLSFGHRCPEEASAPARFMQLGCKLYRGYAPGFNFVGSHLTDHDTLEGWKESCAGAEVEQRMSWPLTEEAMPMMLFMTRTLGLTAIVESPPGSGNTVQTPTGLGVNAHFKRMEQAGKDDTLAAVAGHNDPRRYTPVPPFPMPDYCSRAVIKLLSGVYADADSDELGVVAPFPAMQSDEPPAKKMDPKVKGDGYHVQMPGDGGVYRTPSIDAAVKRVFSSDSTSCHVTPLGGWSSLSDVLMCSHTEEACWGFTSDFRHLYCRYFGEARTWRECRDAMSKVEELMNEAGSEPGKCMPAIGIGGKARRGMHIAARTTGETIHGAIAGTLRGVAGVIAEPLLGAKQGGAAGFAKGLVSGVTGLVRHPLEQTARGMVSASGKSTNGNHFGLASMLNMGAGKKKKEQEEEKRSEGDAGGGDDDEEDNNKETAASPPPPAYTARDDDDPASPPSA